MLFTSSQNGHLKNLDVLNIGKPCPRLLLDVLCVAFCLIRVLSFIFGERLSKEFLWRFYSYHGAAKSLSKAARPLASVLSILLRGRSL